MVRIERGSVIVRIVQTLARATIGNEVICRKCQRYVLGANWALRG